MGEAQPSSATSHVCMRVSSTAPGSPRTLTAAQPSSCVPFEDRSGAGERPIGSLQADAHHDQAHGSLPLSPEDTFPASPYKNVALQKVQVSPFNNSAFTPLSNGCDLRSNVHPLLQHHTLDLYAQASVSGGGLCNVTSASSAGSGSSRGHFTNMLGCSSSPEMALMGAPRESAHSASGESVNALAGLSQELKRLTWLGSGGCGVVFKGEWKGAAVGELSWESALRVWCYVAGLYCGHSQ